MSDVEPEIDDDHPLALELSSLRTAVARFQVSVLLPYIVQTTYRIPSMRHIHPHSNYSGTPWKPPWPSSARKPSNTTMLRRTQNSPLSARTPTLLPTPPSCSSLSSPSLCAALATSSLSRRTPYASVLPSLWICRVLPLARTMLLRMH